MVLESQQMQSNGTNNNSNSNHSTPFRCKRLMKQALEGAQSATGRFKGRSSSSNQRGNISLLGGEWVGSFALLAVCYRRLEDFSKSQQQRIEGKGEMSRVEFGDRENDCGDNVSSIASPQVQGRTGKAGASLFSRRSPLKRNSSSTMSVGGNSIRSMGGHSMRSSGTLTVATTNPRPKSERVVDRILHRLEKQHFASMDDDDNLTYYTYNSNLTSNTANTYSSTVAPTPVWNQDVLGGRAGALQALYWLRKEFDDADLAQDLVVDLAVKILDEGLSTASTMNFHCRKFLEEGHYDESEVLFWVLDSQGAHKAYLGASRGVVGILHTLLGLSNQDWELLEEQIPNAKRHVRNTIDVFVSEHPAADRDSAEIRKKASLHERFLYHLPTTIPSATATTTSSNSPLPDAQSKPKPASGNLRPRLDAPEESNTTVDWAHGATGLAMLFLEASKVFRSKEYLQEAHRLCDTVIYPRGLLEQRRSLNNGGRTTKAFPRTTGNSNKKGPVGLAGMAACFLQLSQYCSNVESPPSNDADNENEGESNTNQESAKLPPKTSLQKLWKTRAALYAQHAYQEWTNYMKSIPSTGAVNAYSIYEGMGGLVSLLWQLSLSTIPTTEKISSNGFESNCRMSVQMPFYSLSFEDNSSNATEDSDEALESILLSFDDVKLLDKLEELPKPKSPVRIRRTPPPKRVQARAEEAEKLREEQASLDRAAKAAQRRAELEARKKAQMLARKKASEVARQKQEEASKKAAQQKEEEDKSKREALLLARKQAKERVEARRKAKEEEERARVEVEARKKAIEAENRRKAAEEDAKKRKALAEARLRRQQKEAEAAKQREEERKKKEELDRLRRVEELKQKEEIRKQKNAQSHMRQTRLAQIAKEKEKEKLLQEEADKARREKELKLKEADRKKQAEERRQRLAVLKERRRKEELALAQKTAMEEAERKAEAQKAKEAREKRRLQLREERMKEKQKREEEQRKERQKQEDERLRKKLQQALDKEVEKQRLEEKAKAEADRERKMQEAIEAIHKLDKIDVPTPPLAPTPASPNDAPYSPAFLEKKPLTPSHFSVPTKSSLFWSLQTDSNIGTSESYKPALVATDSPPSNAAMSTNLE